MTTQVISRSELIEGILVKYLSEIHQMRDKIRFFEKKYKSTFIMFERKLKKSPENFRKWDDYIEWGAYLESFDEIMQKIKRLNRGDFKIA